ncbi:MAG TPA: hypothetical protein VFW96_07865 [Thermomicrobiales bacterium]|nr:hypothetical protein [Thermomicrobiales bacterium]
MAPERAPRSTPHAPRPVLAVVLALALLAAGRLAVVACQYDEGIAALRGVAFRVTAVQWDTPERLTVTLVATNDSAVDLQVTALNLDAALDGPGGARLGATANRDNPYGPFTVPAHATARATRLVAVIHPEAVAGRDRARQPLRFAADAALALPVGTRTFDRQFTLRWAPP